MSVYVSNTAPCDILYRRLRNTLTYLLTYLLNTVPQKKNLGPDYKKILRLSYDVIITYDNRKSNLR